MQIDGKVLKVHTVTTKHGNKFRSILIQNEKGNLSKVRFLVSCYGQDSVKKGDSVSVSGVPVVGGKTNVGAARVKKIS